MRPEQGLRTGGVPATMSSGARQQAHLGGLCPAKRLPVRAQLGRQRHESRPARTFSRTCKRPQNTFILKALLTCYKKAILLNRSGHVQLRHVFEIGNGISECIVTLEVCCLKYIVSRDPQPKTEISKRFNVSYYFEPYFSRRNNCSQQPPAHRVAIIFSLLLFLSAS